MVMLIWIACHLLILSFTRGRASANRPLLLIEPSYKVNGEDRTKSQTRRTSGEQDNKAATRPTLDNQVDVKSGPSDVKAKEKQTLDSKEKETSLSDKAKSSTGDMPADSKRDQKIAATPTLDTELGDKSADKTLSKLEIAARTTPDNQVEVKAGQSDSKSKEKQTLDSNEASFSDTKAKSTTGDMPTPDSKRDQNIAGSPVHVTKPGDKVLDKTLSKSGAKTAEVLTSNSSAPPVPDIVTESHTTKKRPKNKDLETAPQNTVVQNPASAVPETSGKKVSPSTSNSKQTERLPDAQTPASRPVLEENIVLGVALDGSKRTLPIEEEMSPSATTPEVKELAASRGGSVSPASDKDKIDNHNSSAPGAAPADK